MGLLREYLRENCLELFESLERSWDIAFDTWLPAVAPNKDTYNSFPHLRNLEMYADKLVVEHRKYNKTNDIFLTPFETYILLASILFHDIGKALESSGHGIRSRRIIEDNWAELGIANDEIAKCIGQICEFHDWDAALAEVALGQLCSAVIDPYGPIRVREIAVFLMLIDHIDGSTIRVVPNFIKKHENKMILGAFRSKIRGIEIDLDGGMVKLVIAESNKYDEGNESKKDNVDTVGWFKLNSKFKDEKKTFPETLEKIIKKKLENIVKKRGIKRTDSENRKSYFVKLPIKTGELIKQFGSNTNLLNYILSKKHRYDNIIFLIICQVLYREDEKPENDFIFNGVTIPEDYIQPSKIKYKNDSIDFDKIRSSAVRKNSEKILPDWCIISTLLGNVFENVEALLPIRSTLSSIGLPIRDWLIEYKDHLYDYFGNETFEPVFSKIYLTHTVECMWTLSTRIFASGPLKFETLAAEMRENDLTKVYRAVRRLSIISTTINPCVDESSENTEESNNPSKYPIAIWFSDTHWKWNIQSCKKFGNEKEPCKFLHVKKLIDHLDSTNIKDRGYYE